MTIAARSEPRETGVSPYLPALLSAREPLSDGLLEWPEGLRCDLIAAPLDVCCGVITHLEHGRCGESLLGNPDRLRRSCAATRACRPCGAAIGLRRVPASEKNKDRLGLTGAGQRIRSHHPPRSQVERERCARMGHRIASGSAPVYHGDSAQAKRRPPKPTAAAPVVFITGPTAAGKTTLARDLETGKRLTRVPAGSPAKNTEPASAEGSGNTTAARLTDLAVLAACDEPGIGVVVDAAGPAALLLPPRNAALLVRVDAASAVPWGLDIADQAATRWRFDLVIRCPDEESCRSAQRCTEASRAMVRAALSVYRRFLRNEAGADEVLRLSTVAERHRSWLTRIAPMLLDPAVPHTLAGWKNRLSRELAASQPQGDAGT